MLPFSLQPHLSAADGSDIRHLTLNLNFWSQGMSGPYSLVVFVKTAAFLTEDSLGNVIFIRISNIIILDILMFEL